MKKLFVVIALLLMTVSLSACKKYTEEAGVYELYYMSGSFNLSNYEYYTIELKENGDAVVKSKGNYAGAELYEEKCTFKIVDGKIKITTRKGFAKVVEEYDYVDGEIHMLDVSLDYEGTTYTFTAKFKRLPTEG